jgi:hypothetical protein
MEGAVQVATLPTADFDREVTTGDHRTRRPVPGVSRLLSPEFAHPGAGVSLSDVIFGRPLASQEVEKEEITVATGVPVLGLDGLASTAYGPEAVLSVLLPLGVAGLHYLPWITFVIVAQLFMLYLSYRQTQAAYPNGGGAYLVAKDNIGTKAGLVAGVALLLDYLLNVAVAISAGVGAVVSALPALHPHRLSLCLPDPGDPASREPSGRARERTDLRRSGLRFHRLHRLGPRRQCNGAGRKTLLYLKGGPNITVLYVPWHLRHA